MWKKSENSDALKPAELELSGNNVILRRGYHRVAETGDVPEHWTYEEAQMTSEQYQVFLAMKAEQADIEDALMELAEMIAGGE